MCVSVKVRVRRSPLPSSPQTPFFFPFPLLIPPTLSADAAAVRSRCTLHSLIPSDRSVSGAHLVEQNGPAHNEDNENNNNAANNEDASAGAAGDAEATAANPAESDESIPIRALSFGELAVQSREYNIDLAPKLVMADGPLVTLLVQSGVHKYTEFKVM